MIATPRSGLWTPGGRRPPNFIALYDAAGEDAMAANLARGASTSPTIVRATERYFQNGSSFAALAADHHAVEQDSAGRKFLGVYGAATSVETWSSPDDNWVMSQLTDALGGDDSPIVGLKWTECTEIAANAAHYHYSALPVIADDDYCSFAVFLKKGARRYVDATLQNAGGGFGHACFIRIDTNDMSVLEAGQFGGTPPTYVDHVVEVIDADTALVRLIGRNETGGDLQMAGSIAGALTDDAYASIESYMGSDAAAAWSVVGHSMVNAAEPYYGPPIVTAGAPVTKNAEIITRPVGAYSLPGTWEFVIRTDDTVPTDKRIFAWYDASSDAVCELYLTVDGYVYQHVNNGAGDTVGQSVAVAVNDGIKSHRVRATFATNNCALWVDGTLVRDVSCAMPDVADLDVYAEASGEGGNVFDGEIEDAHFWPAALT